MDNKARAAPILQATSSTPRSELESRLRWHTGLCDRRRPGRLWARRARAAPDPDRADTTRAKTGGLLGPEAAQPHHAAGGAQCGGPRVPAAGAGHDPGNDGGRRAAARPVPTGHGTPGAGLHSVHDHPCAAQPDPAIRQCLSRDSHQPARRVFIGGATCGAGWPRRPGHRLARRRPSGPAATSLVCRPAGVHMPLAPSVGTRVISPLGRNGPDRADRGEQLHGYAHRDGLPTGQARHTAQEPVRRATPRHRHQPGGRRCGCSHPASVHL